MRLKTKKQLKFRKTNKNGKTKGKEVDTGVQPSLYILMPRTTLQATQLLNIAPNTDFLTVKKAYKTLKSVYGPSKNPGNKQAKEMMRALDRAVAILKKDTKTRKRRH